MSKFKEEYEFEKRIKESAKILEKYPDRVPVIVEIDNNWSTKTIPVLEKSKYLVPDITLGSFIFTIRKKMKLDQATAIFVMAGTSNVSPTNTESVTSIYQKYKDEDGFLYLTVCGENFFG